MFFLRCSRRHMSWQPRHPLHLCLRYWRLWQWPAVGNRFESDAGSHYFCRDREWSSFVRFFEGHEISPTWAKCHQLDFFDGRMFPWSSLVTVHLGKVMTAIPERNTVEWMPAFYAPCELKFQRKKCKRPDKSEGASLLDSPQHFFNVAHACIFSQDDFFLW